MGDRLAMLDLDGVLCDDRHRVEHALARNWGTYFELMDLDSVWRPGRDLYDACIMADYDIAYLTGRREDTRRVTKKWLKRNGFDHKAPLIMRREDDRRKLPELKAIIVGEALHLYDEVILYDDDPLVIEKVSEVADAQAIRCTWHIKPQRLVNRGLV